MDADGIHVALLRGLPFSYQRQEASTLRDSQDIVNSSLLLDSVLAACRQGDAVTTCRSGITVGGQVGKHLRMHPATVVTAIFPEVR